MGWMAGMKGLLDKYNLAEWWEERNWAKMPKKGEWERRVEEAVGGVAAALVGREEEGEGMATLQNYRRVKQQPGFEEYLVGAQGYRPGTVLRTKLRGGTHGLRVSQGRQEGLARQDRVCLVCNSGRIEDEEHFVMDCEPLSKYRSQMWTRIQAAMSGRSDDARALRIASRVDKFDFVLGSKSYVTATPEMDRAIARGLAEMYDERKRCLYGSNFRATRVIH